MIILDIQKYCTLLRLKLCNEYCVNLAEVDVLVFGPEFIGRVEEIAENISKNRYRYRI